MSSSFNTAVTMTNRRDTCQASTQLRVGRHGALPGHSGARRDTVRRSGTETHPEKSSYQLLCRGLRPSGGRRRHALGQKPFGRISTSWRSFVRRVGRWSGGEELPLLIKGVPPRSGSYRPRRRVIQSVVRTTRAGCSPILPATSGSAKRLVRIRQLRWALRDLNLLCNFDKHRALIFEHTAPQFVPVLHVKASYGLKQHPRFGVPLESHACVDRWTFTTAPPPEDVPVKLHLITTVGVEPGHGSRIAVLPHLNGPIVIVDRVLTRFAALFPATTPADLSKVQLNHG
jgi:hypothetical protein